MTDDSQYTPPPGILVPDGAQPAVPPPPAPYGFPLAAAPTLPLGGFATAAIVLTGSYTALSVISAALTQADGNVAEAARILQTDRANLYRRLRRLGIEKTPEGEG